MYSISVLAFLRIFCIIVVLVTILTPNMEISSDSHRKTICLAQLKQLGWAMRLYAQDNDNRLPQLHTDLKSGEKDISSNYWMVKIKHYVKEPALFKCPGDGIISAKTDHRLLTKTSYAYRDAHRGADGRLPAEMIPCSSINDYTDTSLIAFIKCQRSAESAGKDVRYTWTNISGKSGGLSSTPDSTDAWWSHQDGTTYLYMDGHVQWFRKDAARKIYLHPTAERPQTLVF